MAQDGTATAEAAADPAKKYSDLKKSKDRAIKALADRYDDLIGVQEWIDASGKHKTKARYVEHDPDLKWVKLSVSTGSGIKATVKESTVQLAALTQGIASESPADLRAAEEAGRTIGRRAGQWRWRGGRGRGRIRSWRTTFGRRIGCGDRITGRPFAVADQLRFFPRQFQNGGKPQRRESDGLGPASGSESGKRSCNNKTEAAIARRRSGRADRSGRRTGTR